MHQVIALDVGGTHLRSAVVDDKGNILARQQFRANFAGHSAPEEVIGQLATAINSLHGDWPDSRAVGIGFPGFFQESQGILIASPNLPELLNVALVSELEKRVDLPVSIQNDALCAALGEQRFGAGVGCQSLLHITLGTGVGGGLILNGEPYSGERGMAMEFGHLCVERGGNLCGCGNQGCVETYASATAVRTRFLSQYSIHADADEVHRYAMDGHEGAKRILAEAGHYLGLAIAETIKLFDLYHVTVSGGLTGAWQQIIGTMQASMNAALIPPMRDQVSLLRSQLGDDAGLLGAAALASLRHPWQQSS
ncbi:MAG: ROK family protein [Mariprofundaceae bacterium]